MKISKQHIKDFLVAFSFVNLCFVRVWYPLVIPAADFYQGRCPEYYDYFALLTNALLLTLVIFFFIKKLRKTSQKKLITIIFLVSLFLIYRSIQLKIPLINDHIYIVLFTAATTLATSLIYDKFCKLCLHFIYSSLLIFSIFWLYACVASPFFIYMNHQKISQESTRKQTIPQHKNLNHKIIWIIFDELDQRYVFESASLKNDLPSLNEFYENYFHATNAKAPTDRTVRSILSYLLGEQIQNVVPENLKNGWIRSQSKTGKVNPEETLFHTLFNEGYHIGISGWHLPYCRLFYNFTDACYQFGSSKFNYVTSSNFTNSLEMQLKSFLPNWPNYQHKLLYEKIWDSVINLLNNNKLNFLYFHLPLPHLPKILGDEKIAYKTMFTNDITSKEAYESNLKLADKAFGEIESILKKNNEWDNTTIIITADHWWRLPERTQAHIFEVPMIIKLPYQQSKPYTYTRSFSSILVNDLILEIAEEKLNSSEEIAHFIDLNMNKYPLEPTLGD